MIRPRVWLGASVAVVAGALSPWAITGAEAVHQTHHEAFLGTTSQDKRIVIRALDHTNLGIRVRWHAACESGALDRTTRLRNVGVGPRGRFDARRGGVRVRGKIGFDAQGRPVFPEPFSFANNEARGRLDVVVDHAAKGRCRSGKVTWTASR